MEEEVLQVSERDGCIYLSPQMDNIHQVRSLEDGTFFFDLLIPGYKEVYDLSSYNCGI